MSSTGRRPVVVTGATGFIGAGLSRYLVEQGFPVRDVARSAAGLADGVAPHRIRDLRDEQALARALEGAGAVIHLAGRAHITVDSGEAALDLYHRINAEGTAAVLDAADRAGVERFILASSVSAVGEASSLDGWDEMVAPVPSDPYGRSKLEAERILLRSAAHSERQAVGLRLPLVYGPGVKANMLKLFQAVHTGLPLPLGRIENKRSLLYTGNLHAAVLALLESPTMGRGVYFLSDGEDVSTPELVRRIGRALGRPTLLLPMPLLALKAIGRVMDLLAAVLPIRGGSAQVRKLVSSLSVDCTRFREDFRYTPPWTLDQGLADTARWFLSQREQRGRRGGA